MCRLQQIFKFNWQLDANYKEMRHLKYPLVILQWRIYSIIVLRLQWWIGQSEHIGFQEGSRWRLNLWPLCIKTIHDTNYTICWTWNLVHYLSLALSLHKKLKGNTQDCSALYLLFNAEHISKAKEQRTIALKFNLHSQSAQNKLKIENSCQQEKKPKKTRTQNKLK